MTLNDHDVLRSRIYKHYKKILENYYITCKNTHSLNRALSAFRNYKTFAEVTGMKCYMEYDNLYCLHIAEMMECIEDLAQNQED